MPFIEENPHRLRQKDLAERRRSLIRRRRRSSIGFAVCVVAVIAILALVFPLAYHSSTRHVTVVVNDKERVCDSGRDGKCRYLIYTDHGTYQVSDSLLFMRFNSSDVYGRIFRGRHYDFEVAGWRLPFASHYPNVIREHEVRGA